MRRILAIAALAIAAVALLLIGTGAGGDGGTYEVRAIFDNANSVTTGEQVRVAGVTVGTIQSLDVTPDKKAVVVLGIDDSGFQDFRTDAHCIIRPQSLIGEQYVECEPTLPRAQGQPEAPALPVIQHGPGKGQRLLPLSNTSSPVGPDLLNDIMRVPQRERLTLILNEFGTGLAGNGRALNDAIKRANPALQQTDQVLAILARQNRILANLAKNSDTVLTPLAAERRHVQGFINSANAVGRATAEQGAALQQNFVLLPPFLRQLTPTANALGAFADQATPVISDVGSVAPSVNQLVEQLAPFANAGIPAFQSLGQTAVVGTTTLPASEPTIAKLATLSGNLKPLSSTLAALLGSLRTSGGIEFLMRFAYYGSTAINGFDQFGHYLRAEILTNQIAGCSVPASSARDPICNANFVSPSASNASAARSRGDGMAQLFARLRSLILSTGLRGRAASPASGASATAPAPSGGQAGAGGATAGATGASGAATPTGAPGGAPSGGSGGAPSQPSSRDAARPTDGQAGVLDYLLGGGR